MAAPTLIISGALVELSALTVRLCARAISLGGDSDTLAAIAGPMAYAYYKKMPDAIVCQAIKKLPDWMVNVNDKFDEVCNL